KSFASCVSLVQYTIKKRVRLFISDRPTALAATMDKKNKRTFHALIQVQPDCFCGFPAACRRWVVRIAVVGAGAIGGFYGLMLARAGHELHFVVRGDYQAIRDNGMQLVSAQEGDFRLASANVYRDVAELPPCDL